MKRVAHALQPNAETARPQTMVFVDTETVPTRVDDMFTQQVFRLGVAHYWRLRRDGAPDKHEWLQFQDIGTFWDWMLKKAMANSTLYLIAHNLSFDAMVLQMFPQVPRRGWRFLFQHESGSTRLFKWGLPSKQLNAWLADGHPIQEFHGKKWSKSLLMLDNCNIFGGSLEKWGVSLGFPKLTMPIYSAPDNEWLPYCKKDVEIMLRLWQEWFPFLDEHNLGTFHSTIGSQAFSGFRHAYMHNRIEIHTVEDAIKLERSSYLGGRTEPFFVGTVSSMDLFKLDVNSMYPYVMREHTYPTHLQAVGSGLSIHDAQKTITRYGMIATVKCDISEPVFPVKQGGKNIYPVGELTTTLTTPEIQYALTRGWIREIGAYAIYRMRPIFKWYVDYFYTLKARYDLAGDTLRRSLVKLLQNSLYGKFGQVGYQDRIIGTADPEIIAVSQGYDIAKHCYITIYTAGGIVIEQRREGEGYNSLVAIPAHVTAYARLYLWSLIQTAGRAHVFYVDTDSLIVDRAGFDNLHAYLDPGQLGSLKVEDTATSMKIQAPKDYIFGDKVVKKGVTLGALALGDDTFEIETWPGLLSHLASGKTDTFYNRNVVKHLSYDVDWGTLQGDGWIEPFTFGVTPLEF